VTNFARSLAAAGLRSRAGATRFSLAAVLGCLLALVVTAPAAAIVTEVGGTSVGLEPRTSVFQEGNAGTFANTNGNAVLHGTNVYPVYWDPQNTFGEHHEWMTLIDTFFQRLGAASGRLDDIFSPLGQYRDRSNQGATYSTDFKGAYTDFKAYPAAGCTDPNPFEAGAVTCLTDAQLRAELQSYVGREGLPTGMNTVYYVILPPGVTLCLDAAATHCSDFTATAAEQKAEERGSPSYEQSFCSYHGDINPHNASEGDASTIIYGAIPWTAGTLGLGLFSPPASPSSSEYPLLPGRYYEQGFDCQDGGWNAETGKVRFEQPRGLSKEEEEILKEEGKHTEAERKALEERRYFEGPHQEEPNQEGKDEPGDFSAGLADLTINQIAVEQADIVTDPLLNAWHDSEGHEAIDLCRNTFGAVIKGNSGGSGVVGDLETQAGTLYNTVIGAEENRGDYYVNNVFSLSGVKCVGGTSMVPRFTAPNPVNAGETVGFDGMESSVGLLEGFGFAPSGPPTKTYATFTWNFGDGTEAKGFAPGSPVCEAPWLSPCAGSVFHTYAYGGTYAAKLTVTDIAGNTSSETHTVTVAGPPAPGTPGATGSGAAGPGAAGAGATGSGTGTGTGKGAGKGAPAQPGKPVATASVISHSLKTAVKKGVAVAYSVNEQVTGRFEVLIAKSLANKLKISGTPATGLPAGSAPELVIGKAILVTTKGGHSIEHVMLSKSASTRLRHAHKAQLMLRLIVRNAGSTPLSTTVISAATLVG